MKRPEHITILGGGPAGLALGYYARKNGLPFTLYEARNRIGGNTITLKHGDFLFDSGAHRFHDKDVEVTKEVKKLLGDDLRKVGAPSMIYHNGKFLHFPFSPFKLMKHLGWHTFFKAVVEVLRSRLEKRDPNGSFKDFAIHTYGNTIANSFLLNYSEKLWGVPCDRLSTTIAGKRMKGLDLNTFVKEALFGRKAKSPHIEGAFYYPRMGIGTITAKLAEACGGENILMNSRITGILHNHRRVQAIEVNGEHKIVTDEVVSTLPLDQFIQMMEPKPPEEIVLLAKSLRYRSVILVALFLDRESYTEPATVYFPDAAVPFTRIYEPRNRSIHMSPPGKTSLVAEIPCHQDDRFWRLEDDKLIQLLRSHLIKLGWIKDEEIIGAVVSKLNYAYPIFHRGYEDTIRNIFSFLQCFSNLQLSGRNGRFMYTSIHTTMKSGKEIIEGYIRQTTG